MADSERLEQEGAKLLAEGGVGNTMKAGWNSALAWGSRLAAGDEETVKQAAIGAAVIVATTVVAIAAELPLLVNMESIDLKVGPADYTITAEARDEKRTLLRVKGPQQTDP
jgi:hypothetical protein